MYCRNCGKEIDEGYFCRYCGEATQAGITRKNVASVSETIMKIRERIRVFGHDRLINIFSWFAAAVGIINRVMHNEIETVFYVLAQEDYFVLAEESRGLATAAIWIHIVLCGLLLADVWSRKIWISKGTYASFVITLLIQFAAMLLRIPAPY